jgi:hypothetical protein
MRAPWDTGKGATEHQGSPRARGCRRAGRSAELARQSDDLGSVRQRVLSCVGRQPPDRGKSGCTDSANAN